jgi:multiple sugar transport system permease protein
LTTITETPIQAPKVGPAKKQRQPMLMSAAAGRSVGSGRYLHLKLLAPILIFEGLFVVWPIIKGCLLALQQTNYGKTSYVGLANFRQLWHDPFFWAALRTTLEFTLSMVVLWLFLGLAVALMMNWSFKGRGIARALLCIPWAVPDIPVVLTFLIMLDPNFGVVNRLASSVLGVNHHILWTDQANLAFLVIIFMTAWKGFPFFGLVILSSLQSIPDEYYEAAMVDGASVFRRFRSITLPVLMPTLTLLTLLAFIASFQQFSLIQLSTGGGPGQATTTIAIDIYQQAFQFFNYNYAAAMGVIGLFLAVACTIVFVIIERRIIRKRYLQEGMG